MRWDEFLNTADRLARGATEGDWRSAVSRAYYGVFHYFRESLLAHGLDVGRGGACHFNLYAGLLHCGVASLAPIASKLDRLREARVSSDYDLGSPVNQAEAADRVRDARLLATAFQTALASASAAQIAAGAKRYLQSIGRIP